MFSARTAVAAAATVLGVLALGACTGGTGASDADSSPAPAASSPAGSASGGSAPASGGSGTSAGGASATGTGGPAGSADAGGDTTAAGGGAPRCRGTDIRLSWATGGDAVPDPHSTQQQEAFVVLKNVSGHSCVLDGFPGADLVGGGQKWPLVRSSRTPRTVELSTEADTQFTVTFLPWSADGNAADDDFAPAALVVTLPGERTSTDLPWRWGHVLRQDAATHPGTYVGPIGG